MVAAALSGKLVDAPTRPVPRLRLSALQQCAGVSPEVLDPRATWSDATDYDRQAEELASRFDKTFAQYGEQS